ncbi:alpha/beta fold hydrolase [Streptomyces alkaliphilus]|uniref:Alpha/beta fold hydrolase n=1 Tax=Streptomyces alkaliphilus TaxID=1472722 RepID=A0A7W3TDR7_9ACTN|nr:alpha/beta fold hydrolase [Streptomyces alkaliphilus]MBB0244927.1 alpha/beta fold hydrolase [Streptomyces alkaliphilus]
MAGWGTGVAQPRGRAALEGCLRCREPRPGAATRMVCFPHAGGAAGFFSTWTEDLAPDVEVWAVQYPGRQDRFTDPFPADVEELAATAVESLLRLPDRPLVLFGHSLGALVAYETARLLERARGRSVAHLVVSGRRAPSDFVGGDVHLLSDESVIAELTRLGGTDEIVLNSPELLRALLPAIRDDFRLAETYRHRPGAPLRCPVTAVIGTEDPEVSRDRALRWAEHTAGPFALEELPGDHFYLVPRRRALLRHLTALTDASP